MRMKKASNAPEHLKRVSACNICEFLDEKRNLEEAIEHEKRYSKKYGVTNLSKIESYKQSIMQIDELIPQQKKEYKKYSGKTFDTAQCRNKKLIETCGENEDKLQKEIRRIIEERINTISQDSNKSVTS